MTGSTLAQYLGLLLSASLKGSVLLLVALIAMRFLRSASAAARHAVLAAALGALLVLPLAQVIAPQWRLAMLPGEANDIAAMLRTGDAPAGVPFSTEQAARATESVLPLERVEVREQAALGASASLSAAGDPAGGMNLSWVDVLLIAWIAGAAFILLRLLAGMIAVALLERRATMVTDGGWLQTAHALAQRLGLSRGVTLLFGDRGTVPLTWGVLQPVVWLPADAERWDGERRTVVLAHELAHVKRRDAVTQWIANLALALHWFNPLVWLAVRQLRAERERACDDAVLSLGTQPTVYAEHLLALVRTAGRSGGPAAALAMARRSQFEGRLLSILDGAARRGALGAARTLAIAAMAMLFAIPLAGMSLVTRSVSAMEIPGHHVESGGYPALGEEPRHDQLSSVPLPRPGPVAERAVEVLRLESASGDQPLLSTQFGDSLLLLEIISAANGMGSSVERGRVLTRVARMPDLSASVMAALLDAAAQVPSEVGRSQLVTEVLTHQPQAVRLVPTRIVQTVSTINSSALRRELLVTFLRQRLDDGAAISMAVNAAQTIGPSVEKRRVAEVAITASPRAFAASAGDVLSLISTISSSTERSEVLAAMLSREGLPEQVLVSALMSTAEISSSTARMKVLYAAVRGRTLSGAARNAYMAAASSIPSDAVRAQALSILLSGEDNSSDASPGASRARSVGEYVHTTADTAGGSVRNVRFAWRDLDVSTGEVVVLGRGASLDLEEQRVPIDGRGKPVTRRMLMSLDRNGEPSYDFCIDDVSTPIDAEVWAWFRSRIQLIASGSN
jgi:beta-lactamase regulating signal transducer with metallopeptidase domain